jgi:hypothetical protein
MSHKNSFEAVSKFYLQTFETNYEKKIRLLARPGRLPLSLSLFVYLSLSLALSLSLFLFLSAGVRKQWTSHNKYITFGRL